jgi:hypothetical protein
MHLFIYYIIKLNEVFTLSVKRKVVSCNETYKYIQQVLRYNSMNINDILNLNEAKADPEVVDKFAGVSDSQRSYYIYHWAKEKGIDSDDAMEMAGYTRGSYIGQGSYNWHYNPPRESLATEAPVGMMKKAGQAIGAKALGAIGMKGKASNLAGKADLSDTANTLYNEFRQYLGTQELDIKNATGASLVAFLKSKRVKNIGAVPKGPLTKDVMDKAFMQAAKEAMNKQQGVKGPVASPAQNPVAKKVKVSSAYVKTKDAALTLNAKEKRRLIQQLEKSIKVSPAKNPTV